MVRIKPSQSRSRVVEMLYASIAQRPYTSPQWPAALWRRNYVLRVKSYLVSLPDILAPGLLETEKLLSQCQDVTNDVEGVLWYSHPSTVRGQDHKGMEMNEKTVNCIVLKLSQRNFRGKYVLPSPRNAKCPESREGTCHQLIRRRAKLGGKDITPETVKWAREEYCRQNHCKSKCLLHLERELRLLFTRPWVSL